MRSAPCGSEVAVCNLDTLLKESSTRQQPISLFIEGMDTGDTPVGLDRETGTLTFVLERTNDN